MAASAKDLAINDECLFCISGKHQSDGQTNPFLDFSDIVNHHQQYDFFKKYI